MGWAAVGIAGKTPRVSEGVSGTAPNGEQGGEGFNAHSDRLCSGPSILRGRVCPEGVEDGKTPQEGLGMGRVSLRSSSGDVCFVRCGMTWPSKKIVVVGGIT